MNNFTISRFTYLVFFILITTGLYGQTIRYVKQGGSGSGTSWADASGSLQAMINQSQTTEVWVAAGTYTVGSSAFIMRNGVAIYGGFPASGNPAMADRDWATNTTTITGGGTKRTILNNYTQALPLDDTAILDGFTLTNGSHSDPGGAVYNNYASPTMRNLIITGSKSSSGGGGVYNSNSSPTFINVTISGNQSGAQGGGMHNAASSSPKLINVVISGNVANNNSNGGGIFNIGSSAPELINVTISGNRATNQGGAMFNNASAPKVYNSIFYGNNSGVAGNNGAAPIYYNSLIQGIASTTNGNISGSTDPLFTDAPLPAAAPFTNGDYRLKPCSPVINMGSNTNIPAGVTVDLAGSPRRYNNVTVDMGAYEYQAPGMAAPTASAQTHTTGSTVANLIATGQNLKWYTADVGGTALAAGTQLQTQTYYVSQTIDDCESIRTAVIITITHPIKYVKQGATGNGTSWANASGNIQAMIDAGGTEQVWVAAGTYRPTVIVGNGTTNRDKAFVMKEGVRLYGGFAGVETELSERNWATNVTTLSGDLGGSAGKVYHVVVSAGTTANPITANTVLDGFTITGGDATGPIYEAECGGGMSLNNSSQTIANVTIIGNKAIYGGGMYNLFSSPTLNNVKISGNQSTAFGGGIWSYGSMSLTNVTIDGNVSGSHGGGVYLDSHSPVFTNVTITGNKATWGGGGLFIDGSSSPVFTDVVISDNEAEDGGGIFAFGANALTFTNVTLRNNAASENGGGMYGATSSLTVTNSEVSGNTAKTGGGLYMNSSMSQTFTNVIISGNSATTTAGGMYNNSSPTLANVTISGNNAPTGGGIFNSNSSLKIVNSIVYGNSSGIYGDNPLNFNSLIQGFTTTAQGNINGDTNPMFVNMPSYTTAPFTGGDYRLAPCSPVINMGNNTHIPAGIITDLGGNPRRYNAGKVDMGAYEFQALPGVPAPTAGNQSHATGSTVANLTATGQNLKWYTAATGGTALASTNVLLQQSYYVSQTVDGCEGPRKRVVVTLTYPIKYVKQGATGNGSSWANASGDLQAMIDAAGTQQVWVAAGTYTPTRAAYNLNNITLNNKDNAFVLKNGVNVYGGFEGTEEILSQRDWKTNVTELSGSMTLNGTPINAYHVVIGSHVYYPTVFDGFTVTGGNANVSGEYDVNNHAVWKSYGGGIHNVESTYTISNVIIKGNRASFAAGLNNYKSPVIVKNVQIIDNESQNSGGGIINEESSSQFTNVEIRGNRGYTAAGIFNLRCDPAFNNIIISGNIATGGVLIKNSDSNSIFTNVIISGNKSPVNTNIISDSGINFQNSIISGNSAGISPSIISSHSLIQGLTDTSNGNIIGTTDPKFVDAPSYTTAPFTGGDYRLAPCSPLLNIGSNTHISAGITTDLAGNPRIYNNGIVDMGAYEYQAAPTPVPAPVASNQSHPTGATVANLTATGQNLKWYTAATGGTVLASTDVLLQQTYYVSQTIDGCESPRKTVAVTITYPIKYIKAGATGNGISWTNASGDLQAMINAADTQQVWVAAGTYQPGGGLYFYMKNGVKIYGGFPAAGNPTMEDRDWVSNVATLQGNGNSVISNSGITATAVLDGFTITGGNSSVGGGFMNIDASPTLTNLTIHANIAMSGGGMYNAFSSPTLINITISGNTANYGGGVFNTNSLSSLINVTVSGNIAVNDAGGIYNESSSPILKNSIVYGNSSGIYGGNPSDYYNSIIQGVTDTSNGNISGDTDPMFVNMPSYTTAPFTGGDYRLKVTSLVINKGNNSHLPVDVITDLAGNPRIYGNGIVDMGAYEFQGSTDCAITTTWAAGAWSNGAPTSNLYAAVIDGDFTSANDLTACSLTVSSGNVTVSSGDNFIIKGKVTVNNANATMKFENGANLVQADNVANEGDIFYYLDSNPLQYLDYTIWSSPTSGTQTLKEFSPTTLNDRFYVYNTSLNAYSNYTSASGVFGSHPNAVTFTPGKGYLIRMPAGLPASPPTGPAITTVFQGKFTGVPNNGDISIALGTGGNRFNAVGNPYPSPINLWDFINGNSNQLDNGTLYLWRKTNGALTTTYATVTMGDFIANEQTGVNLSEAFTGDESSWVIAPGQGFFVKAAADATALNFTNSMRRAESNSQFFRMPGTASASPAPNTEFSRYKLNISTTAQGFGQAAIGYSNLTTNALDYGWDGRLLNDGDLCIYTIAGNARLGIQARAPFIAEDTVMLGYKAANAGSITISLSSFDGLFAQSQDIYLKDSALATLHNLKEESYTFTSAAGTFDSRFQIVYVNDGSLSVDNPADIANDIIVYKSEDLVHIKSSGIIITNVDVYDTRGRLLYTKKNINDSQTVLSGLQAEEQVLLVMVKTDDGMQIIKKIIY